MHFLHTQSLGGAAPIHFSCAWSPRAAAFINLLRSQHLCFPSAVIYVFHVRCTQWVCFSIIFCCCGVQVINLLCISTSLQSIWWHILCMFCRCGAQGSSFCAFLSASDTYGSIFYSFFRLQSPGGKSFMLFYVSTTHMVASSVHVLRGVIRVPFLYMCTSF